MSECMHGLDTEWCSTCKLGPTKNEPDKVDYVFTVKYDGDCSSCNLPVHVGQRAAKTIKGRLIHERCKP
jgi:hypothetical protein